MSAETSESNHRTAAPQQRVPVSRNSATARALHASDFVTAVTSPHLERVPSGADNMRQTLHWLPSQMAYYPALPVSALPDSRPESATPAVELTLESLFPPMPGGQQSGSSEFDDTSMLDTVRSPARPVDAPPPSVRLVSATTGYGQRAPLIPIKRSNGQGRADQGHADQGRADQGQANPTQAHQTTTAAGELVKPASSAQTAAAALTHSSGAPALATRHVPVPAAATEPQEVEARPLRRPSVLARMGSIVVLLGILAGIGYLTYSAVLAFTDAWVAPTNLSPDSDAVIRLNLEINRQAAEMERLRMTQARIRRDITAAGEARKRLAELRDGLRGSFKSKLDLQEDQYRSSSAIASNLKQQRGLLIKLREQHQRSANEAKKQLEAGLIGKHDYEARLRELSGVELRLQTVTQRIHAAQMDRSKIGAEVDAWSGAAHQLEKGSEAKATPEVMTMQERLIQVELRLFDLETEERSLERELGLNAETLQQAEQVLERLKQRPLYRALKASTDVAFVPYSELKGVSEKSPVYACEWLIFFCKRVGEVAELLQGEVVAQDPSGEPTRGRYAILKLSDRKAVREAALRIRD